MDFPLPVPARYSANVNWKMIRESVSSAIQESRRCSIDLKAAPRDNLLSTGHDPQLAFADGSSPAWYFREAS